MQKKKMSHQILTGPKIEENTRKAPKTYYDLGNKHEVLGGPIIPFLLMALFGRSNEFAFFTTNRFDNRPSIVNGKTTSETDQAGQEEQPFGPAPGSIFFGGPVKSGRTRTAQ